ncbi:DUF108 domain-containing protein [Nocardiopsis sp. HNM0947]|uniref:DUF108 domain-containing protein n=1 Tax=Nocardiopsis coralli TaxID=2772213 RepID=A0ABR9P279_9ACTN|nr:aspartate dehydrogenase domain-containing protein [Nocardiopsis coralli]MBE2997928.1 DUF108 domain-containing protein [Nocardiopsis coralli]
MSAAPDPVPVAVLGAGAIGGVVARALHAGEVPGARLVGVVHADPEDPPGLPVLGADEAIERAELVVECAGQRALAVLGPKVVARGRDLLVASVGALTDPGLWDSLDGGPGRLLLCTGAVGGLDLLRAAAAMGPLEHVHIETTKRASSLVQDWMGEDEAAELRTTEQRRELMNGPARKVASSFPKSANVAASVALAAGDWDVVSAAVVADPEAGLTSHVITARGAAGEYRFEIRNHPSELTPTTSGVVPHAVLRAVAGRTGATGVFV